MQEARRSLFATGVVVTLIVAVVVGGLVRNRMELGPGIAIGGPITMESLVSSTDGIPSPTESKDPISESTFFYHLTLLLEKEYYEDIKDEQALAIGAVRGMVNSLADSDSVFMKPEQMAAFRARLKGTFEGVGAELKLQYDEAELKKLQNELIGSSGLDADVNYDPMLLVPTVIVTTVVPGSSAEKAGLRVGDRVTRINGKWALSSEELSDVKKIRERLAGGEIDQEQAQTYIDELRKRFESTVTPGRAIDQLVMGTTGKVDVEWRSRDGKTGKGSMDKGTFHLPAVKLEGNVVTLRFFSNAPEELAALDLPRNVVIDLRQSTIGDFDSMRKCLAVIGQNREYGKIKSSQAGKPRTLSVSSSSAPTRNIQIVADDSTWGAAAVFASALVKTGTAGMPTGNVSDDLPWIDVMNLPDGSGYTLRTGTFVPGGAR
jgi:carboxyl-terminal processing protease